MVRIAHEDAKIDVGTFISGARKHDIAQTRRDKGSAGGQRDRRGSVIVFPLFKGFLSGRVADGLG